MRKTPSTPIFLIIAFISFFVFSCLLQAKEINTIQVGLENENFAEVLRSERQGEGVKEGESVIIEGHFTLAHDARVRILE